MRRKSTHQKDVIKTSANQTEQKLLKSSIPILGKLPNPVSGKLQKGSAVSDKEITNPVPENNNIKIQGESVNHSKFILQLSIIAYVLAICAYLLTIRYYGFSSQNFHDNANTTKKENILLEKGDKYFDNGNYDKALKYFIAAKGEESDHEYVNSRINDCLNNLKERGLLLRKERKKYNKVLKKYPSLSGASKVLENLDFNLYDERPDYTISGELTIFFKTGENFTIYIVLISDTGSNKYRYVIDFDWEY
jgi:tetratricopeptide (TPR) repeat protein